MMILGIISDTHDQVPRTIEAIRLLKEAGVSTIIHCGDVTCTAILDLFEGIPTHVVLGNNDDDDELRLAAQSIDGIHFLGHSGLLELGGKRIGVTHGHMHKNVRDLFLEVPDYLLTGHSHLAMDEMHGKIRRINPGALHRARRYSVATLNLQTDDLQFLPIQI